MKFWVYDKARRGANGPYEVADLKKMPGFGPDTVVAPDGATAAQAWKPVSAYPELKALLKSQAPPLPVDAVPASSADLVSCPSCGKSLSETALTCPSCGRLGAGIAGKYDKVQIFLFGSGLVLIFAGESAGASGNLIGVFLPLIFGGLGIALILAALVYSMFRKKKALAGAEKPVPSAGDRFATGVFYFLVALAVLGLIWLALARN